MRPKSIRPLVPTLAVCAAGGPAWAADIFVSGSQGAGFDVGLANRGTPGIAGSGGTGGDNTSNGNGAGGRGGKRAIDSTVSTTNTPTTVSSGATLGGSGSVGATLVQGAATLAPGVSGVGTLPVNGTTLGLNDASILNFDFNPLDQTAGGGINDLVMGITNFTFAALLGGFGVLVLLRRRRN